MSFTEEKNFLTRNARGLAGEGGLSDLSPEDSTDNSSFEAPFPRRATAGRSPAQFMDSAMTGLITTVTKIKRAYEAQIGRKVHQTTIYRLLDRHEWRSRNASLSSS